VAARAQVTAAVEALIKRLHDGKKYTDTANFTLRCGTCNTGLKGEKEAVEHAKATGHQNFQEY
jgi:ubiquitin thioesterase OTU1